jgi:hypothetical protein
MKFGDSSTVAVIPLALCSTYLHFGTEPRMYSLILLLSALVFYCLVRGKVWTAGLCLLLLPLTHYYAAIAIPFYGYFAFVMWKGNGTWNWKKWLNLMILGLVGVLLALVYFALPQMQRAGSAFFEISTITSWPSSVLFAFFMVEWVPPSVPYTLIYFAILALIVFFFLKAFRIVSKAEWNEDAFLVLMGSSIVFPLLGLMAINILGASNYANLYHHRFFLVITWLFVVMSFVYLERLASRKRLWGLFVEAMVFLSMLFMTLQYLGYAHHELQNLMRETPCSDEMVYVAHESAFSALTYEVWAREKGCNWYNFISTNLSERRMNGGGADAMPSGRVFYNLTMPMDFGYYYVRSAGTIKTLYEVALVKQEDGVELVYVSK